MRDKHVVVAAPTSRFSFAARAASSTASTLNDRRLARIVQRCRDCPARSCSSTSTSDGERQTIESADVNDYLREISRPGIHRQGFPHLGRHGAGGDGACASLRRIDSPAEAKKNIVRGDRACRRAAGQHAVDLPQVLCPSGGARRLSRWLTAWIPWRSAPRMRAGREHSWMRRGDGAGLLAAAAGRV